MIRLIKLLLSNFDKYRLIHILIFNHLVLKKGNESILEHV